MLLVHELHEARDRVLLLVQKLKASRERELPAYRTLLDDEVAALEKALQEADIPERYRVAVVGRFKVGKSSFVNKLAQETLAGVETSPETAAISVFRYSDEAKAEVEFVSTEEWEDLRSGYQENPESHEVKRYAGFIRFNDRLPTKDKGGIEGIRAKVNLEKLATDWIQKGGHTHTFRAASWKTKDDKKKFRAEVRKFTSSQEPLHYLVNKLTIHAPIPVLKENIELVDTPGLDDTEHFRVRLTEELVQNVDAILFLTTSGASYGQSDKDFLIRQLRRRQIKHLQIIVTKGDETFENARRDAIENDDTAPNFEDFRAKETSRVRSEIHKTLSDLLESNQLSEDEGYYFIEQLDSVPIYLISTKFHEEGKLEHGGIDAVRDGLFRILSTSHRFEQSKRILSERLGGCLNRLRDRYTERHSAIGSEYDPKKVKAEIEAIRAALGEHLDFFDVEAGKLVENLAQQQSALVTLLPTHLENITFRACEVLAEHEIADLIKHWRTRRTGNWGYQLTAGLQGRIADQIFPKVELQLNDLRSQFGEFLNDMGTWLTIFQDRVRNLEEEHRLTGLEPMALAEAQRPIFDEMTKRFAGISEAERNGIVNRLDDFVTSEVSNRLNQARNTVSNVSGTGTTWRQSNEVQDYYRKIKSLLMEALQAHLRARFCDFAGAILENAKSIAPSIRNRTLAMVEQRLDAIASTLSLATAEEKVRVSAYLEEMRAMTVNFAADPVTTTRDVQNRDDSMTAKLSPMLIPQSQQTQRGLELVPRRFEIRDGETGHTYESVFRPYLDDAVTITVEDPYIRLPNQVDNFARFCALALRLGAVKEIELISGKSFGEDTDEADSRLENLRRDLKSRGVALNFKRDEKLHDRELRLSNGWVIKIGRGLDIYHRPESWSSVEAQDFSLRRCKQTKIEILREQA